MSRRVYIAPPKYIQGPGVLQSIGEEAAKYGKNFIAISDETVWDIVSETVEESFSNSDATVTHETFAGVPSESEADRIAKIGKENNVDGVIGFGGGASLDTAKFVANKLSVPVISAPTTASSDSPTTHLSVVYTDNHEFERYEIYDNGPELVIVDSELVVNAPAEQFASGIADAIATHVEAVASVKRNADTMTGSKYVLAGLGLSEKSEEILFEKGLAAYLAVKENILTPQVEDIIEANTLLSGVAAMNAGLSGAHAVHDGLYVLDGDVHDLSHGEKVAYGVLTHLVLIGESAEVINSYADFFNQLGLPTTLEDMHLDQVSFEDLVKVGEFATSEDETMKNLDPSITAEQVASAMLAVNEITTSDLV